MSDRLLCYLRGKYMLKQCKRVRLVFIYLGLIFIFFTTTIPRRHEAIWDINAMFCLINMQFTRISFTCAGVIFRACCARYLYLQQNKTKSNKKACIVIKLIRMVEYFCHHLSDNYVDLSYLYVDLSVIYLSCQMIM